MRFNHIVNNFASGEWSPKMRSRSDTDQFKNSAKEITNGIVQIQGGVFKRPGTRLIPTSVPLYGDTKIIPYTTKTGKFLVVINYDTMVLKPVGFFLTPPGEITVTISGRLS